MSWTCEGTSPSSHALSVEEETETYRKTQTRTQDYPSYSWSVPSLLYHSAWLDSSTDHKFNSIQQKNAFCQAFSVYFLRSFCSSPPHCPQSKDSIYSSLPWLCSLTCIHSWILFQLPAPLNLCRSPAGVLTSPAALVDLLNANYLLVAAQSLDIPTPSKSPAQLLLE